MNPSPRRLAARYNMIVNLAWTILHLMAVTWYCITRMPAIYVYIFLLIGFIAVFVSTSLLEKIQFGKSEKPYKKIGITIVRKFSQDGDIINNIIRKKYPGYTVTKEKSSITNYIGKTYFYERFHLMGLLFMLLVSIYAFYRYDIWWAIAITINNVLYNLYPMLLQQYNRVRILKIVKAMEKI